MSDSDKPEEQPKRPRVVLRLVRPDDPPPVDMAPAPVWDEPDDARELPRPRRRAISVVSSIARIRNKEAGVAKSLLVVAGDGIGTSHPIASATLVIGRSSKCDVVLDDESVARAHAKIIDTGKVVRVRDLGSEAGTFVNDEPVDERMLADGDLIRVGSFVLKYSATAAPEPKPVA